MTTEQRDLLTSFLAEIEHRIYTKEELYQLYHNHVVAMPLSRSSDAIPYGIFFDEVREVCQTRTGVNEVELLGMVKADKKKVGW